jgi:cell division protein FtsW (lipid II flippase)
MSSIVENYYAGGRLGALVCCGLALLAGGVGVYLAKAKVDFWSGFGWALFVGSALVLVAGGAYFVGLGNDHASYSKLLADDAPRFFAEENDHIAQALRSFYWVILGEMSLVVVGIGLILLGQARSTEILSGIGVGIALIAVLLAFYDSFNRQRATSYHDDLQASSSTRVELPSAPNR